MNEILDEHLIIADAKVNTKRLKIAILTIVVVLIVGIFYHKSLWGINNIWDIFYYITISTLQSIIVSGVVLIVSGILNLVVKRSANVFRNSKLYINSVIIGNSIWISVMLAVIAVKILYQ